MAMCMRGQIDGDTIHAGGKVGPVVEVHATQKILVGFAIPRVLRDHHAWDELQCLSRTK